MSLMISLRIIYRAGWKWSDDGGMRMGAALAYYAIFSTMPFLLIALYFAAALYGGDAALGRVHVQLENVLGHAAAKAIEDLIDMAGQQQEAAWTAPTLSVLFLIVGALSAFADVRTSLSTIWKLQPPYGNTWLGMLWDYLLALVLMTVIALLILVSLAASLAVPIVWRIFPGVNLQWVELAASFIFLTAFFTALYRILSAGRISWGYVIYGSFIAAVLFSLGKTLLSYYLVYTGTESMYGAAGSIVVFMVWIYYSSQILFFGAELIQARRTRHEWMDEKPLAA